MPKLLCPNIYICTGLPKKCIYIVISKNLHIVVVQLMCVFVQKKKVDVGFSSIKE